MVIKETIRKNEMKLKELREGAVFRFTEKNEKYVYTEYYMKLSVQGFGELEDLQPCVNLNDNKVYFMRLNEIVDKVDAELVVR